MSGDVHRIIGDLEQMQQIFRQRAQDYSLGIGWTDKSDRAVEIRKAQAGIFTDCAAAISILLLSNKPKKQTTNTLEPVIAFIDQRIIELRRHPPMFESTEPRMEELQMIRTLCTGLIEQDQLLKNALAR